MDATDRGLLLGDGVFDTSLAIGGRVFQRDQHLKRLEAALGVIGIPADGAEIAAAMDALAAREGNGSLRITVTRGPGPRGIKAPADVHPTILGSSAPLNAGAMFAPIRLGLSAVRRNETSPLSRLKALSYLDAVLAAREIEASGATEALFLNTRGTLACSSLANVFVVEGFELATPPLKDGVLPGILRGWVLAHAEDHGLRPIERSIPKKALDQADAIFLTNSLRLVSPATLTGKADSADVPEALRRLMAGLCEAIAAECGTDPRALGAAL
ncbi:class IV aminotransferase [Aureimonas sp. Leaf460]|nr:class IV aminotransferase [Aureimonas sp. Leaf427]KQT81695.1 class IV aminotransferase [Aureimonas sp. Leaf460]